MLPPNPIRSIDNSLSNDQAAGEDIFFNKQGVDANVATCVGCHETDPGAGFFGTGGDQTFEGETQTFKVAHMRNLYHKIGMFGMSGDNGSDTSGGNTGDQIRGFGFLHDGSIDTVESFLSSDIFILDDDEERQAEAFSLVFPTDLAPIVGQQVTLTSTNAGVTTPRLNMMITRAGTEFKSLMLGGTVTECDLIVKGSVDGEPRGAVRESNGQFRTDTNQVVTDAQIRDRAVSEGPLTYTCVPPGSGNRMGINRDQDNFLDGLDNCPGVVNNAQQDLDADGIGDACDPDFEDADSDGVADHLDNCPLISNADQTPSTIDPERGEACETLPPGC
jgi:hypothetical protein